MNCIFSWWIPKYFIMKNSLWEKIHTLHEMRNMKWLGFYYSKNVTNVEVFCKGILLRIKLLFLKNVVRKWAEDGKLILHLWTKWNYEFSFIVHKFQKNKNEIMWRNKKNLRNIVQLLLIIKNTDLLIICSPKNNPMLTIS